ncbi:hypothetical protein ADUPG1_007074 [Aduncisulcus paluster]|uniref:Uncharacterized protein n=1 Tax=Aduncisulcus paluster TaxID=2918883 RepID=A0ABQ5KMB5_9EUKA|nr:hypothetical protein ADUPG1_007074 [Aduncisulcus paluster]
MESFNFLKQNLVLNGYSDSFNSLLVSFRELIENSMDSFTETSKTIFSPNANVFIRQQSVDIELPFGYPRYSSLRGFHFDRVNDSIFSLLCVDNGCGICAERIKSCLSKPFHTDKSAEPGKAGRYGVGLKTVIIASQILFGIPCLVLTKTIEDECVRVYSIHLGERHLKVREHETLQFASKLQALQKSQQISSIELSSIRIQPFLRHCFQDQYNLSSVLEFISSHRCNPDISPSDCPRTQGTLVYIPSMSGCARASRRILSIGRVLQVFCQNASVNVNVGSECTIIKDSICPMTEVDSILHDGNEQKEDTVEAEDEEEEEEEEEEELATNQLGFTNMDDSFARFLRRELCPDRLLSSRLTDSEWISVSEADRRVQGSRARRSMTNLIRSLSDSVDTGKEEKTGKRENHSEKDKDSAILTDRQGKEDGSSKIISNTSNSPVCVLDGQTTEKKTEKTSDFVSVRSHIGLVFHPPDSYSPPVSVDPTVLIPLYSVSLAIVRVVNGVVLPPNNTYEHSKQHLRLKVTYGGKERERSRESSRDYVSPPTDPLLCATISTLKTEGMISFGSLCEESDKSAQKEIKQESESGIYSGDPLKSFECSDTLNQCASVFKVRSNAPYLKAIVVFCCVKGGEDVVFDNWTKSSLSPSNIIHSLCLSCSSMAIRRIIRGHKHMISSASSLSHVNKRHHLVNIASLRPIHHPDMSHLVSLLLPSPVDLARIKNIQMGCILVDSCLQELIYSEWPSVRERMVLLWKRVEGKGKKLRMREEEREEEEEEEEEEEVGNSSILESDVSQSSQSSSSSSFQRVEDERSHKHEGSIFRNVEKEIETTGRIMWTERKVSILSEVLCCCIKRAVHSKVCVGDIDVNNYERKPRKKSK